MGFTRVSQKYRKSALSNIGKYSFGGKLILASHLRRIAASSSKQDVGQPRLVTRTMTEAFLFQVSVDKKCMFFFMLEMDNLR